MDLEQKRKRIELLVKVVGLGVIGFLVAPFIYATIQGIVGLAVAGVILVVGINLMPAFGALVANWRLKALKAVAAADPIATLENRYRDRQEALGRMRENIKQSYAVLQGLHAQIQEHNEKYPHRPSQYLTKYTKLQALVANRGQKYKQAQKNLAAYGELIDEKRSDWKIAQTMAEASKLANVGEDFTSKLLQDTALITIQDGLNMAFSELETSMLDEDATAETVVSAAPAALPEKCEAPDLDLGFDETTLDAVPARR